jgi:hypothetical protein
MRNLFNKSDLLRLGSGVGLAAAAGLLLGGAMRPELGFGDAPGGPQMLAGVSGVRGYDQGGAAWTSYDGQPPEHVIGTDWLKPPVWSGDIVLPEADSAHFDVVMVEPEPLPVRPPPAWDEPPREPVRYPSMAGGAVHGADLPPPPTPPVEAASVEDEAAVVG